MAEKLYRLPATARAIGVSVRTLYRYINIDATKPEKLKIFAGVTKMEYPTVTHYYFTSSDIRAFNRKYGKPGTREKRISIKKEMFS